MQSRSQWPDSSEMWSQYIAQSTEYTYELSSQNLKKHMDNKTKEIKSLTIQVYTKFEEFILICEAMNAECVLGSLWLLLFHLDTPNIERTTSI